MRVGVIDSISRTLRTTVGLLQTLIVIAVGVRLLDTGDLSTEGWTAFFLYSASVAGISASFTGLWEAMKGVQGTTARVGDIVDAEPERGGSRQLPPGTSDIVVKDVSFTYHGTAVLPNVSVRFKKGTVTALVGPSGSGKSTLLTLLQRLYEPTTGEICVHDAPLAEYPLDELRTAVRAVSQRGFLVSGTIRDNVLLGVSREVEDDEVLDALCVGGDRSFLANLPAGLDTEVGAYGDKLSGGQRHRVALARALLLDTPFLLLDEPTAALDGLANLVVLQDVRRRSQGRTVIITAHTPAALEVADSVVVLEQGRVTAQGSVDEVYAESGFVRDICTVGRTDR